MSDQNTIPVHLVNGIASILYNDPFTDRELTLIPCGLECNALKWGHDSTAGTTACLKIYFYMFNVQFRKQLNMVWPKLISGYRKTILLWTNIQVHRQQYGNNFSVQFLAAHTQYVLGYYAEFSRLISHY